MWRKKKKQYKKYNIKITVLIDGRKDKKSLLGKGKCATWFNFKDNN